MEVVITWCVGIRVVRLISAGSVLDRGNLTDHHGMCVCLSCMMLVVRVQLMTCHQTKFETSTSLLALMLSCGCDNPKNCTVFDFYNVSVYAAVIL